MNVWPLQQKSLTLINLCAVLRQKVLFHMSKTEIGSIVKILVL